MDAPEEKPFAYIMSLTGGGKYAVRRVREGEPEALPVEPGDCEYESFQEVEAELARRNGALGLEPRRVEEIVLSYLKAGSPTGVMDSEGALARLRRDTGRPLSMLWVESTS